MKQSRKPNVSDVDNKRHEPQGKFRTPSTSSRGVLVPKGNKNKRWSEPDALELWKYFGNVGTADKNTMVTVVSWLLGLSTAIIGYIVTNLPLSPTEPFKGMYPALLGVVISGVAGYVSLLYGGYSNWNWAQAVAIARDVAQHDSKWGELLPENSEAALQKWTSGKLSFYTIAMKLGKPRDPTEKLAPIFSLYTWLALFAALFHLMVFLLSAGML